MAENACEPGAGVRDRRVYAFPQELRCSRNRLLRWRQAYVRGSHTQRVYAVFASGIVQEAEAAGNKRMPVRKPARDESGTLGCRIDGGQNGGVQMANAGAGGAI